MGKEACGVVGLAQEGVGIADPLPRIEESA